MKRFRLMLILLAVAMLISCVSCKTTTEEVSEETQILFDSRPSLEMELIDYTPYATWLLAEKVSDNPDFPIYSIRKDVDISLMWQNWIITQQKLEEVCNYSMALENYIEVLDKYRK